MITIDGQTITSENLIIAIIIITSVIILITKDDIPKPLKILLTIIALPFIPIIFLIKIAKRNKKYYDYKKEMNKIYHKSYCPLIKESCNYGYCEFWNDNTKECDLKK